MRHRTLFLGLALVAGPSFVSIAQINIVPPSTAPAPEAPPPAAPATAPSGATLPSAQSVLENLINDRPSAVTPPPATAPSNPALTPAIEASAPNEPKTNRLREGNTISGTGRLIRDEKTSTYVFAFDADGKQMQDPPLTLLPSRYLMSMEEASDKGTRATKFRISGEVTEYRGKNYLYVRYMLVVRDLNHGIGG